MDSDQINSLLLFVLLVALSAFFSSSETAYTSINHMRLKSEAENGDRKAQSALDLQNNYDSLLSTVLIGNNLVKIASSVIAALFFVELLPTYGALFAVIVTTVLLLLFGEITPKLYAKLKPETLAKTIAPILRLVMKLFKPIVWLFEQWQTFIKRIFPLATRSSSFRG